jgi:hypothetical protein
MSEENCLIGKTFICVTRELPAKVVDIEEDAVVSSCDECKICEDCNDACSEDAEPEVEKDDIGLLIDNDNVDWDKFEGERTIQVIFKSEKEVDDTDNSGETIKKKEKTEKSIDAKRHTKNADLKLMNVHKQDIIDAALATLGKPGDVPLVIEVYHDVGAYDPTDLQCALQTRELYDKLAPDLKIMGYTKEVNGNNIVFTGEIIKE